MKRLKRTIVQPNKGGRPSHVPTTELRTLVTSYAAVGYTHDAIAARLRLTVPTLHKWYREELDVAKMDMLMKAQRKLAEAVDKGESWAICFTLKTQGKSFGWTERTEHTGKDGEKLFDLSSLSDSELVALKQLVSKTSPVYH